MIDPGAPVPVRLSAALYRMLTGLYPGDFRRHVGAEMAETFRRRSRDAWSRRGAWGLAGLWARALPDLLLTAFHEHRRPSRTSGRTTDSPERGHTMTKTTMTGGSTLSGWLSGVGQDLRYGVRMLVRNPGFTAATVVTLALGIGLNAATFSAVHSIFLRPLPGVEEPDRLAQLYQRFQGDFAYGSNSIPHYRDLRDRTGDVFENVAAYSFQPMSLSADGRSERIMGMMVSANFFQTYGVEPLLGRAFIPAEESRDPGAHPVAVISHGFWQERFGGSPEVLGRTVVINGHPFEIVGVTPPEFNGPMAVAEPPIFVPLMMQREVIPGADRLDQRRSSFLQVTARLRNGVIMDRAEAAMDGLYRQLRADHPDSYSESGGITFVPQSEAGLHPSLGGAQMGMSAVLLAVVGLLLLIACVNVANLFLARARGRRTEMGVRMSLGAGRGRVIRQLFTESLVFSLVAGGAGLLIAFATARILSAVEPPVDGPWRIEVVVDGTVLLFTLLVSLAAAVAFGLAPALQASGRDMASALKAGGARSGSRSRLTRVLVVAQMALSLILLVSSGLFLRSLQGATAIDTGFEAEGVLLARVDPGLQGYEREEARQFFDRLLERVRAVPGVHHAALGMTVPLGFDSQQTGIAVPGYEFAPDERRSIDYTIVGEGYFEAMGMEVVAGRTFGPVDGPESEPVIMVNRRFADRYWPGESALGRTVASRGERRVVGVVETGKYKKLGEDPLPYMWFPHDQVWSSSMILHVKTAGEPGALAGPIRREIRSLDPDMPAADITPLETHLGLALMPARLGGTALGLFGLLGLFLAAVGIYGVMAYSVAQRSRELGIRMALGASYGSVVRMVLKEGMALAAVGGVIGLVGAVAAARLVEGLLYDVDAFDPVAFGVVPVVLLTVAALAVYVPAHRAAGVDPVRSLKSE